MQLFTIKHSEETVTTNELVIQAETLEDAIQIYHRKRQDGSFFTECELTYEGTTDSWDEVELPDGSTHPL